MAIWRDVEVAHVEVGREVRELTLRAGFQVEQPEILVRDLSSQDNQRPSVRQESDMSGAAAQRQFRQARSARSGCAFTANVVPISGPEYTRRLPSVDHT